MAGIEDILKLDKGLSEKIEDAQKHSQEIIENASKEADKIIESVDEKAALYKKQKEAELKGEIEKLRQNYLKEFDKKKEGIAEALNKCKQELKDYIVKRIIDNET